MCICSVGWCAREPLRRAGFILELCSIPNHGEDPRIFDSRPYRHSNIYSSCTNPSDCFKNSKNRSVRESYQKLSILKIWGWGYRTALNPLLQTPYHCEHVHPEPLRVAAGQIALLKSDRFRNRRAVQAAVRLKRYYLWTRILNNVSAHRRHERNGDKTAYGSSMTVCIVFQIRIYLYTYFGNMIIINICHQYSYDHIDLYKYYSVNCYRIYI